METFTENEYCNMLAGKGYNMKKLRKKKNNKQRWFIYDFESAQSYKLYTEYLTQLNKTKNFDYLKAQQKLF